MTDSTEGFKLQSLGESGWVPVIIKIVTVTIISLSSVECHESRWSVSDRGGHMPWLPSHTTYFIHMEGTGGEEGIEAERMKEGRREMWNEESRMGRKKVREGEIGRGDGREGQEAGK